MDVVFWVCAVAGVALLVVGIVADGTIVPAAGAFAAAFGILGLVAGSLSGGNTAVALLAGLVGGLALAVLAARLVRGAMRLRTDATPTSSDLLGRFGRVVTPIDGDAAGEVLVQLSGQRLKLFARAGGRLPVGTDVAVVEVLSPSSMLVGLVVLVVLFVVTGSKGQPVTNPETGEITTDLSGQKVVMGASVFVVPFVQRLQSLDLSSRQIIVSVGSAVSANGIRCALEGVAIVKVGGTEDQIRASAQRFLDQQDDIESFTTEVLAGSLRSIVGRLTVEEIIRDRAAFAREVAEEAEASLTNQGLVLDTFQLQDIQAEAHREAEQARLRAEEEVAEAQRQLALRQAQIRAETDAALAEAEAAGPKAKALQDREVLTAQQEVASEQASLKERQLDTEVRKPADASRYAVEQDAEARKSAAIRDAEARRAATIAAAEAEAEEKRLICAGERQQREELAKAVRLEGDADASAILARGGAEAESMQRKADAYEQYGQAAIIDLLAQVLPEVVRAASEPLGSIDRMTVISTDGASQLTRTVANNVEQSVQVMSDLAGVDIASLVSALVAKAAAPNAPIDA